MGWGGSEVAEKGKLSVSRHEESDDNRSDNSEDSENEIEPQKPKGNTQKKESVRKHTKNDTGKKKVRDKEGSDSEVETVDEVRKRLFSSSSEDDILKKRYNVHKHKYT